MEQWIKNYLTDALGQVIYAGVGSLTSLESLLSLSFESLLLLEPIKSVADKAAKKYAAENLTIKNATLNAESGLADFTLMQPAKYSSLKTDIQLSSVLKNSKVKSINSIETVSISDLVNQVSLDTQKHNVLILAINGSESACLEPTTLNQLTQFSTLCVQIDNKGIYQQDLTYVAELKTQLREKGFYFAEALQENAIFTNLVFKKDSVHLALLEKNQGLEAESGKIKEESEKLKVERDEEKAQVANKTKQLDELTKATEAKESELVSRISHLEAQVANKTKQLDELKKATEAKESELASRISPLESQVANKTKQLNELKKVTEAKESELASRISFFESELSICNQKQKKLKDKIIEAENQVFNIDSFYINSYLSDLVDSDGIQPLILAGYFPCFVSENEPYLKFEKRTSHSGLFSLALNGVKKELKLILVELLYENSLLINEAIRSPDIHKETDKYLLDKNVNNANKFVYCCLMSNEMKSHSDNMMTQHFINLAKEYVWGDDINKLYLSLILAKFFELIGRKNDAALVVFDLFESNLGFNNSDVKNIFFDSFDKISSSFKKSQHGHDVLLDYLKVNIGLIKEKANNRIPLVVEIGTTRELVAGQGSTLQLAKFCFENNLNFITVDMDEHNGRVANAGFEKYGYPFKAVTMKGEDFLNEYTDVIDVLFLDAYDFDHGNHSELRQERYEKFLGNKIDEELCHKMHLECAQYVQKNIVGHSIICIDDTWIENENWTAKGTTAVPYLLGEGFKLVEARNRAALFQVG